MNVTEHSSNQQEESTDEAHQNEDDCEKSFMFHWSVRSNLLREL